MLVARKEEKGRVVLNKTSFFCQLVLLLVCFLHQLHLRREKEEERGRGRRRKRGKKTMLRKRSRAVQEHSRRQLKGNLTSDSSSSNFAGEQKSKSSPFFSVPGLFVSFTSKPIAESDSMRSPTSPLDYRLFSNLGSSLVRSPRSPGRSWDCSRVGLGLVDSLATDDQKLPGRSESKKILLGSQMRMIKKNHFSSISDHLPKSLPVNYGLSSQSQIGSSKSELEEVGKIDSSSNHTQMYQNPKPNSDVSFPKSLSDSFPLSSESIRGCMGSLSASEIELSEDYTCIISHGPNPKTIHIFGDCILEGYTIEPQDHKNNLGGKGENSHWAVNSSEHSPPFPSKDFLSFCFSCKKKLEEGRDIYMYRGEEAFCSSVCRDQEISMEEEMEMEKSATGSCDSPSAASLHEDLCLSGYQF
ncbi:hypothetical protein AXF42_Ash007268 [Apostasia shenzhenica]|uniref:FLZ-type domain-containing protein n=1 Tax=Apostasia shenzhenica TaxID=1088818 RepID=A0A2I0B9P5_9ASPA|nr:hypothetical protein AXF42_Ash007268 [Apostasia shenzhenica]